MNNKKIMISIYSSIILIIFAAFLITLIYGDIDLGFVKIDSYKNLYVKYNTIQEVNDRYEQVKADYTNEITKLSGAKKDFETEKLKYDSISNETLELIKQNVTSETYNIEYMWIKLGNYAKQNSLAIGIAEANSSNSTTSNENSEEDESTDIPQISSNSNFGIVVVGEYNKVADFIFEVEKDKELRFKLDKINMEYAGNNTIRASFEVKNVKIEK